MIKTDAQGVISIGMYRGIQMGIGNWDMVLDEQAYQNELQGNGYVDNKGNKIKLFELVKKYDNNIELEYKKNIIGVGNAIDVYNGSFSDVHITEYLVDSRFVVKELEEKCNMRLVDSDYFQNMFTMHENYFRNIELYEAKPDNLRYLVKVKEIKDKKYSRNLFQNFKQYSSM